MSVLGILCLIKFIDYSNDWESDCIGLRFEDPYNNRKEKGGALILVTSHILPYKSNSDRISGWEYHHRLDANVMPIGKRIPVNEQKLTFFWDDMLDRQEAV